jgi:hypothetical protein
MASERHKRVRNVSHRRRHPCASGYRSVAPPSKICTASFRTLRGARSCGWCGPPVLLDLRRPQVPVAVLGERWGLSPAWLSAWPQAVLLRGLDRWVDGHGGGRRPQWPPSQTQRCVALLDAGPRVVGGETACGPAVLSRVLLGREGGGRDHRPDGWTLLPTLGVSCPKARVVSAHLDAARRQGRILLAEAARGAQWGAVRAPWARRGNRPRSNPVTSGKAPRCWRRVTLAPGACGPRVLRAASPRTVPKRSCPCAWPRARRPCVACMREHGSPRARRLSHC